MNNLNGHLKIDDLTFEINKSSIVADTRGGIVEWALEINCASQEIEDELWTPRVSSELIGLEFERLEKWEDAFDKDLNWSLGIDLKTGRPHAMLYVFEHTEIYNGRLVITPFETGVFLSLEAMCDVFFDPDTYYSDLTLSVACPVEFCGVIVGDLGENISEAIALERLRKHIVTGNYRYCPPRDEHNFPTMLIDS